MNNQIKGNSLGIEEIWKDERWERDCKDNSWTILIWIEYNAVYVKGS